MWNGAAGSKGRKADLVPPWHWSTKGRIWSISRSSSRLSVWWVFHLSPNRRTHFVGAVNGLLVRQFPVSR